MICNHQNFRKGMWIEQQSLRFGVKLLHVSVFEVRGFVIHQELAHEKFHFSWHIHVMKVEFLLMKYENVLS